MIKFAPDHIIDFIDWLNKEYETSEPCYITVMHGYDCIQSENGTGWAAYYPGDTPFIIVAGEWPEGCDETFHYETIAHEYMHHIQHVLGKLPENESKRTEKEAEHFAKRTAQAYIKNMKKESKTQK